MTSSPNLGQPDSSKPNKPFADANAKPAPELREKSSEGVVINLPLAAKPGTGAPDTAKNSEPEDAILKRRPAWYTSLAAFQYVNKLSKDEDVRIRDSDRTTGLLLLIASVVTLISLFLPQLAAQRLGLLGICDVLVGVMIVLFVVNRFGILSTLKPRQALLAWQLIMGALFFGVFITINIAIAVAGVITAYSLH